MIVDVIVQKAEELWKRKWDGLQGGIKLYMTSRNRGVNSEAEAARGIKVGDVLVPMDSWHGSLSTKIEPGRSSNIPPLPGNGRSGYDSDKGKPKGGKRNRCSRN